MCLAYCVTYVPGLYRGEGPARVPVPTWRLGPLSRTNERHVAQALSLPRRDTSRRLFGTERSRIKKATSQRRGIFRDPSGGILKSAQNCLLAACRRRATR